MFLRSQLFSEQCRYITFVDMSDLDVVKSEIKPNTKMFFVETPTNPMMHVADIKALADMAHGIGAMMVVDNTFLTPYFQRPIELGADLVVHSGTKYLCGHNDVVCGLVVCTTEEQREHFEQLNWYNEEPRLYSGESEMPMCESHFTDIENHNKRVLVKRRNWLKKHE